MALGVWLLAALLIHDGLLSPAVVSLGSLLRRFFPHRGRRYLQAALLMGALVTVVALPMIYLRGKPTARQGSPATELRAQPDPDPRPDAAITLSLCAVRVARNRNSAEPDNRGDEDQSS